MYAAEKHQLRQLSTPDAPASTPAALATPVCCGTRSMERAAFEANGASAAPLQGIEAKVTKVAKAAPG